MVNWAKPIEVRYSGGIMAMLRKYPPFKSAYALQFGTTAVNDSKICVMPRNVEPILRQVRDLEKAGLSSQFN
jgi:hypothetical protein